MSEARANLIPDMAAIINVMYPVGRTIICDHNPETDYPWQTWEAEAADRVLVGEGTSHKAGETGGEETHTLTVAEMPSHTHKEMAYNGYENSYSKLVSGEDKTGTDGGFQFNLNSISSTGYFPWSSYREGITTLTAGNGNAHNNMPPYIVKRYWTRTA